MPITKIDLVNQALSIAGLTGEDNTAQPNMISKGLVSLELSMVGMEGKTFVEYNADENPMHPDGNADSGVKPNEAYDVSKYVSVAICESLAAPFTMDLRQMSRRAYRKLLNTIPAQKSQAPNVPAGQGNLRHGNWGWVSPYLQDSEDENNTTTE